MGCHTWLFIKAEHTHTQLLPSQKVQQPLVPALSEVRRTVVQSSEHPDNQVAREPEQTPHTGDQEMVCS